MVTVPITVRLLRVIADQKVIAVTGDRCGKWSASLIGDSALAAESSSKKNKNTVDKSSKKKTEAPNQDVEEMEVDFYKIDPEKEKQVMKELEELEVQEEEQEKSDKDEKEDNIFV